jgi:hypothetical protein
MWSRRHQLTIIGKGNKQRVIDLDPLGGYAVLSSLPVHTGKPLLFLALRWRELQKLCAQFRKDCPAHRVMGEGAWC